MASVHKSKSSKYWRAHFRAWDAEAGKWKQVKKSTRSMDRVKALEIANEYERIARGAVGSDRDAAMRDSIFDTVDSIYTMAGGKLSRPWDEYSRRWLEMRKRRVALSSYRSYKSHLNNMDGWLGAKRNKPLDQFSLATVQQFYDYLIEDGLSPKSAMQNLKTIGQVFGRAVSEGFMRRNPCEGVERLRHVAYQREAFDLAEITQLVNAIERSKQTDDHKRDWITMIYLSLCTAMRAGDCSRLTFEDIQQSNGGISFIEVSPEKKGEGRKVRIPLIEPLRSRILSLKPQTGPLCPSLYETPVGGRWGLSDQFKMIVDLAQIQMAVNVSYAGDDVMRRKQGFRSKSFHSLRHTLASLLLDAGVSKDVRMLVLDHQSEAVHDGYTHAKVEMMADQMARVKIAL